MPPPLMTRSITCSEISLKGRTGPPFLEPLEPGPRADPVDGQMELVDRTGIEQLRHHGHRAAHCDPPPTGRAARCSSVWVAANGTKLVSDGRKPLPDTAVDLAFECSPLSVAGNHDRLPRPRQAARTDQLTRSSLGYLSADDAAHSKRGLIPAVHASNDPSGHSTAEPASRFGDPHPWVSRGGQLVYRTQDARLGDDSGRTYIGELLDLDGGSSRLPRLATSHSRRSLEGLNRETTTDVAANLSRSFGINLSRE